MKTLLTAATIALALPAGAALAGSSASCRPPICSLGIAYQLTDEFGWSISKMELDDRLL